MKPLTAQRAVDVFTIVVIASVGLALAHLTWRLTGNDGTSPVAVPLARSDGEAADLRPLLALQPFGKVLAAGEGSSGGTVLLRAIMLSSPVETSVVLIAGADGKVAAYSMGQAVGDGVIEAIEAEQIVLRTATGQRVIGFTPQTANASTPAPAPGQAPSAAAAALPAAAPPQAPLTGAAAIRALIPESARGARPVSPPPAPAAAPPPEASTGYRVNGANPAMAAAGIRTGDIVVSVNGRSVAAGASESELLAQAVSAGSARLEIIRDGRRVSFTVPMR